MKLSVNTGFLVNRYPSPRQWSEILDQIKNPPILILVLNNLPPKNKTRPSKKSFNRSRRIQLPPNKSDSIRCELYE